MWLCAVTLLPFPLKKPHLLLITSQSFYLQISALGYFRGENKFFVCLKLQLL